jgi:exodeoxyribonuclease V alpha subunit
MKKQQAFFEIWRKQGRAQAGANHDKEEFGFAERAALALFRGGMISEYDVHVSRMLYDKVYAGNDPVDQGLHLFLVMMSASLNRGNVYLQARADEVAAEYKTMIELAVALVGQDDDADGNDLDITDIDALPTLCAKCAHDFEAAFDRGRYSAIIGDVHKPVVRAGERWFFQKYFHAHATLGTLLAQRLADDAEMRGTEDGFKEQLAAVCDGGTLHPLQKIAVALGCLKRTLVITGGPGTGKTSVVAHMLRLLLRVEPLLAPQEDIILCAPTGRAAARLSESIAREAAKIKGESLIRDKLGELAGRTVHGVLGYDPRTGGFLRGPASPIECRMIVVDEASMLDISLFSAFLSALRKETTLVLLGDRNQLASVDAGAVLGDITAPFTRMTDRLVVLTKSFRSQPDIARVALQINGQDKAPPGPISGFVHQAAADLFDNKEDRTWPGTSGGEAVGVLRTQTTNIGTNEKQWIDAFFGGRYARAVIHATELLSDKDATAAHQRVQDAIRRVNEYLDASAILCVVRKGDAGSERANRVADAALRRLIDPQCRDLFFNGSVAMVTRNMKQRKLWNGDRGIVLAVRGRKFFVLLRQGRFDFVAIEELEGLEPSFAMTVHKSQGCEFDSALVVLPQDKNHPLLTKEIVYTALTRAKTRAVVLGDGDVFDAAIGRKVTRRSGVIVQGT